MTKISTTHGVNSRKDQAMQAILQRLSRVLQIATPALALISFTAATHADIFQWEYINPADPNQNKRQSTTLALDGAGVDAVPGADLHGRNLTMAYLIGADLRSANGTSTNFSFADLINGDLSDGNLTNANFGAATLTGLDFTGAEI